MFRSCCKLVESASFAVSEARQFDVAFNFLVKVLSESTMNIVCRVHAALALRALVEWQRVDNAGHVAERLVGCVGRVLVCLICLARPGRAERCVGRWWSCFAAATTGNRTWTTIWPSRCSCSCCLSRPSWWPGRLRIRCSTSSPTSFSEECARLRAQWGAVVVLTHFAVVA